MITGVQLVEYLLKEYGPLPQKKLQKLAYLAEIEYIKKHGERLSDLSFRRYHYGPFSSDIRNIEDLDDNIMITEHVDMQYPSQTSELVGECLSIPILDVTLVNELKDCLSQYQSKNGGELEEIADNTEPFLETKKLNDPIDLDSYAWYYTQVNSEELWKRVEEQDRKNIEKGVYGKVII
jgi:uncharacterized phage-associated protein